MPLLRQYCKPDVFLQQCYSIALLQLSCICQGLEFDYNKVLESENKIFSPTSSSVSVDLVIHIYLLLLMYMNKRVALMLLYNSCHGNKNTVIESVFAWPDRKCQWYNTKQKCKVKKLIMLNSTPFLISNNVFWWNFVWATLSCACDAAI